MGRWGQTLGKFLAGILVVTKNGKKAGYLRTLGRTLSWYLALSLPLFWYIGNIPFDTTPDPNILIFVPGFLLLGAVLQNKIFFYDYFCGTRVVYKKPIGRLRKTAVILPGIAVLMAICYMCISPPSDQPERSRATDVLGVISIIKSDQERYFKRHNVYADKFTMLDIAFPETTATDIHTKDFIVSISHFGCDKSPCYILTATRHTKYATVAARYGLYSLKVIIPDRPQVQISSCPGGHGNCDELIKNIKIF